MVDRLDVVHPLLQQPIPSSAFATKKTDVIRVSVTSTINGTVLTISSNGNDFGGRTRRGELREGFGSDLSIRKVFHHSLY